MDHKGGTADTFLLFFNLKPYPPDYIPQRPRHNLRQRRTDFAGYPKTQSVVAASEAFGLHLVRSGGQIASPLRSVPLPEERGTAASGVQCVPSRPELLVRALHLEEDKGSICVCPL